VPPDHNLPASLYLSAKPSWWGNLAWPPFGPDISPMTNKIPAQVRYEGGSVPNASPHGVPYSWYNGYGITNNYAQADDTDLDNDGAKMWQEYIAGTDPTDSNSCFKAMIGRDANNSNTVWFSSLSATGSNYAGKVRHYALESSMDLLLSNWQKVANCSNLPGTDTPMIYTDAVPVVQRFYRVKAMLE
jgi:hypothetical protein